jgi:cell division protein FtsI (penicillin-binding protein 3)
VQQTTLKPALAGKAIMPDVRNMTLKDALYLLESKGVKVTAKGKGKVLMQDIAPGTNITKAQTVTLLLN